MPTASRTRASRFWKRGYPLKTCFRPRTDTCQTLCCCRSGSSQPGPIIIMRPRPRSCWTVRTRCLIWTEIRKRSFAPRSPGPCSDRSAGWCIVHHVMPLLRCYGSTMASSPASCSQLN